MPDTNRTGAFLLPTALERSLDGYWENALTDAQFGWHSGGQSVASTTVERLDFATDSTSLRSPHSASTHWITSVGTANYGWWCGGGPSASTSVQRLTFATDQTSLSARGRLITGVYAAAAMASPGYGYIATGNNASFTISTIQRIYFSNDSVAAAVRSTHYRTNWFSAGTQNQNYGWMTGGQAPSLLGYSDSFRFDFSNDTITPIARSNMIYGLDSMSITSNNLYGWIVGGKQQFPGLYFSYIQRADFSNDSVNFGTFRGNLPNVRAAMASAGNSNYGFFMGGFRSPGLPSELSLVERINYSNDTGASLRTNMQRTSTHASAQSGIHAYRNGVPFGSFAWFVGGLDSVSARKSDMERFDFSNSNATALSRGHLTQARNGAGASSNGLYGWIAGGQINPSVPAGFVTTVDRMEYATDSALGISVRGPLSVIRRRPFSLGNQGYAWFGGSDGASRSDIERIEYVNDSPTIGSFRNTLLKINAGAANNSVYGWVGGGQYFGAQSSISRIDFATDTSALSARASLGVAKYYVTAQANNLYGWWSGGSYAVNYSTIERLDFGADLVTPLIRSPLPTVKFLHMGATNAQTSIFAGGYNPFISATVHRINHSNDTTVISGSNLNAAKTDGTGHQNFIQDPIKSIVAKFEIGTATTSKATGSFAWFIGGGSAGNSLIERLNYANDTATPVNRGNFSVSPTFQGKFNNSQFGWSLGGLWPLPGKSDVYRIDFATDSSSRRVTNLSRSDYLWSGASTNVYGYLHGGYGNISTFQRMDFGNDEVATIVRPTSPTANRAAAHCLYNEFYGWWGGGQTPGPNVQRTDVIRLDFSSDTTVPSVRSWAFNNHDPNSNGGSTGNAFYGYFNAGARSNINRFDYYNDTNSTVPRTNLLYTADSQAAASSQNYGYWAMGRTPSFTYLNTINRVDLSNDTAAAVNRSTLSATRYGGMGLSDYGID